MSSSSEEDADKTVRENSTQVEQEITPTEGSTKKLQSEMCANPIAESGEVTEVEEGEVTEATKSESETIGYGQ